MENRRKIIHIDMDAFYASVEQRDNPGLQGKPIVVGGLPEGRGGVVATASYEARAFGIRSAMSSKKALQLCPDAVFLKPRFDVYKSVSDAVRKIFYRYTDLVEPLSLDEAFLDVTQDKLSIGSAITIAEEIRRSIREELQLTASAGVSINKFVAKIASEMKKPDGLMFIGPSKIEGFMEDLPVEKFFGVGKVTAAKMNALNLFKGVDLKKLSEKEMMGHFGKTGSFFYKIVRGIDDRAVEPFRETKSVGAEDTFAEDIYEADDLCRQLEKLAAIVAERLTRHGLQGRTITVKIKYNDFKVITRSKSFAIPQTDRNLILETAKELLFATIPAPKGIRLLGISLSNFGELIIPVRKDYEGPQLKFGF